VLPVGEGLIPFSSVDQATEAIREVASNWGRHSKATREIAEQYFDSACVVNRLIVEALDGDRERDSIAARDSARHRAPQNEPGI
jgi:hypothetical protein